MIGAPPQQAAAPVPLFMKHRLQGAPTPLVHAFDLIVCYALDLNVLLHRLKVVVRMNPHREQDSEEHDFFTVVMAMD
jgi:hypothetical protein